MSEPTESLVFPGDFLWGVATASYQIEGAINEDGRAPSIWDTFAHTPGKVLNGDTGDIACDHYHRYPEDISLMRQLGLNAYRFSIAWPRVLPEGRGQVNQAGLDFYDRLVDSLSEAGITPFLTLYHWDLPQALQDRGGWANRDTAYAFADYASIVARRLGDRVPFWATHNEPWCTAYLGNLMGKFAPGLHDVHLAVQVSHHLLLSHGLAVPALRAVLAPSTQVGIALNFTPADPYEDTPADRLAAQRFDGFFNRWFTDPLYGRGYPADMLESYAQYAPAIAPGDLEIIAAPIDFMGVNYYNRLVVTHDPSMPLFESRFVDDPARPHTADREVYPEGMHRILSWLHREYGIKQLFVSENGAAINDSIGPDGQIHDPERITFYQQHIAQIHRAIEDGVPVKGLFIWSLIDNFEWDSGYSLRYGMVWVDRETMRRIPKDSYFWYRDFIAAQRTAQRGSSAYSR